MYGNLFFPGGEGIEDAKSHILTRLALHENEQKTGGKGGEKFLLFPHLISPFNRYWVVELGGF